MSSSAHAPEQRHVLAGAAVDDPGVARERAQAAPAGLVPDRREPPITERRRAADDRDVADIESAGQPGDGRTDRSAGGEDHGEDAVIAGGGAIDEFLE